MTRLLWAIFGTGAVSAKFVAGRAAAQDAEVSFVAFRSLAKAHRVAAAVGIARAIEGYAEAAAAGGVNAICIAAPPSKDAAHALVCIEAGIPVIVEKPFAANVAEASRIVDAARAKSVFAMETMWTRFLRAAKALREELAAGITGEARLVAGSVGSSQAPTPANRNFDPALGGEAITRLGVYPPSLGRSAR